MLIVRRFDHWTTVDERPKQINFFEDKARNDFGVYVTCEDFSFSIPCTTFDGAKAFYKELLLNWDNPCAILTENGDLISIENFEI